MKARKRKTPWNIGDIFAILLNNQKYVIGQVLDQRLLIFGKNMIDDEINNNIKYEISISNNFIFNYKF